MRFAIVTHVPHFRKDGRYFAYGPYVREMNIWAQHVSEFIIVAPLSEREPTALDLAYTIETIDFRTVPAFDFTRLSSAVAAVVSVPLNFFTIISAFRRADHLHLRCPGNVGLLGCVAQFFFPRKPKTAKYAGNWDPQASQPQSYRLQKALLSSTWFSRRMKVLVYGEWIGSTRNIVPFFTASYREDEKIEIAVRELRGPIRFIFSGALVPGKKPLYALEILKGLYRMGLDVSLSFYGSGPEQALLEQEIASHGLQHVVSCRGSVSASEMKKAFQESHFTLLPSISEGWPKAVAEAMFWKSIPTAFPVSCIPYMLGDGNRGIILSGDIDSDIMTLATLCSDSSLYRQKAEEAARWAQQFTLDRFGTEIQKLVQ